MAVFFRDRLVAVLCIVALMALATALLMRPKPLPPGVARFDTAAPADPTKPLLPTYALDEVTVASHSALVSSTPFVVLPGQVVQISGWALDPQSMTPAASLLVGIEGFGSLRPVQRYRMSRPDVAAALNDPAARDSGFVARVRLGELKDGRYHVRFVVVAANGKRTTLPSGVILQVTR